MKEIIVGKRDEGSKLFKLLKKDLKEANDSFIYKMLRKKNIVLNNKKADGKETLKEGDSVKIYLSDDTYNKFHGDFGAVDYDYNTLKRLEIKDFNIVYEDEDILIINKPAGLLSQKATDNDISANDLFLAHMIQNEGLSLEDYLHSKPSICNRLDRNTSGLLICGKTIKGLQDTALALKERSIDKYYICLVEGEVHEDIHVTAYLKKDAENNRVILSNEKKEDYDYIETAYYPISCKNGITRLRVHLITGKPHQIRAHLAYLGHPIIGDYKYGNNIINNKYKAKYGLKSQLLHAYELDFKNGKHVFAEIPQIFDIIENS